MSWDFTNIFFLEAEHKMSFPGSLKLLWPFPLIKKPDKTKTTHHKLSDSEFYFGFFKYFWALLAEHV